MSVWYSLVELLPFEWAQPGAMYFMKNALLALLVISPLFGILSTMVVSRRMSFFSDALGHSAFTGIAVGAICAVVCAQTCGATSVKSAPSVSPRATSISLIPSSACQG